MNNPHRTLLVLLCWFIKLFLHLRYRACLDQLLIAIRSLITLCDHIRSKTSLITIMNLIATLGIIYASLHNDGLSAYQLSLPPHRTCYCIQTGHGRGERWGVVSVSCSSCMCWVCTVCCVGCRPSCHYLLDRVQSLLHSAHWPTNSRK